MKQLLLPVFLLFTTCHFAQVKGPEQALFYKKNIDPVNALIQKKLVGHTDKFYIEEHIAIYSEMSQWLIYADFKTGSAHSVRLTDSFLYALIFSKEQVEEIESQMILHKAKLDEYHPKRFGYSDAETQLQGFCYDGGHIYLMYSLTNFYGMKTLVSPAKKNSDAVFFHQEYLVELHINDSAISKGRIWDMSAETEKFRYHFNFSIVDDQPALYLKTTIKDKVQYEYILLNREWKKNSSVQVQPTMMAELISDNTFYNEYTLNRQLNLIINNKTGKRLKITQGTGKYGIWSSNLLPYKNNVYISVVNRTENTLYIYKVDLSSGKSDMVNNYKLAKEFNMFGIGADFYIDQATNTLYILNINIEKQFYIVDSIKL